MTCIYFNKNLCHSCGLLNLTYEDEILSKEKHLKSLFEHSQIQYKSFEKSVAADRFSRRFKAKMVVLGSLENPILGYLRQNEIPQDLSLCPLYPGDFQELFNQLKEFIKTANLTPYDFKSDSGELKYIIIQKSFAFNTYMVRFVLRSKEALDRIKKFQNKLMTQFPIQVISANIQPERAAKLEGLEEFCLTDQSHLKEKIGSYYFKIAANNFFQTNPVIAKELYQTAFEWLKGEIKFSLLDLYCGVGGFSFFLSPLITKHMGIEISQSSINSANLSKELNDLKQLHFLAMSSEHFLQQYHESHDVVVVNPPRAGLVKDVREKLLSLEPKIILYSSCNAETLTRDLEELTKKYTIEKVKIFDMFPGSQHYEVLVYLKLIIH